MGCRGYTWGVLCQKQPYEAGTSNCIPQYPCPWSTFLAQHSLHGHTTPLKDDISNEHPEWGLIRPISPLFSAAFDVAFPSIHPSICIQFRLRCCLCPIQWGPLAAPGYVPWSAQIATPYDAKLFITGLTHCSRNIMATIFQTTFSNAYSWMKMHEFD